MSPTKHRRCGSDPDGTTVEPLPPPVVVPADLLLEIFARLDVATIVRCAATSKAVRRAILDNPAFLAGRVEANGGLLLGVSYVFLAQDYYRTPASVGQAPRRRNLRFDAGVLMSDEPVASRGGLVVLRDRDRHYGYEHLRVYNGLTGDTSRLPPARVTGHYPHALLAVEHHAAGRSSFRLLVADVRLRTQIFSSEGGGSWGPVVQLTSRPPGLPRTVPDRGSHPVVLGGAAVHWLRRDDHHWLRGDGQCIVRLDIDKAEATLMALPPGSISRVRSIEFDHHALRLAASAAGELSLLVAEVLVISMWTLSPAATAAGEGASTSAMSSAPTAARWNRKVVIRREAIGRQGPAGGYSAQFLGFGELSSTAILLMDQIGLVQINLKTKEAVVLESDGFKGARAGDLQLCLHEADLRSLLRNMRSILIVGHLVV